MKQIEESLQANITSMQVFFKSSRQLYVFSICVLKMGVIVLVTIIYFSGEVSVKEISEL